MKTIWLTNTPFQIITSQFQEVSRRVQRLWAQLVGQFVNDKDFSAGKNYLEIVLEKKL